MERDAGPGLRQITFPPEQQQRIHRIADQNHLYLARMNFAILQ